jgi:D-erythronate 2-dehydrogenase
MIECQQTGGWCMHILIIGAAGMLGRKLVAAIAGGALPASRLTLADVVAPVAPASAIPTQTITINLTEPAAIKPLLLGRPDVIYHLAAIVSAEAEADFDKGYATNLDATRALFDAIRQTSDYRPRVIFASSIAVFGAPLPDVIPDDFHLTPRSSYGIQKAMAEMLLADYTRRGFLDGIALRLPTICVRPGAPNKAASSFFSGILREPLDGLPAVLPVRDSLRHWFASPRAAVGFFIHAAGLDTARLHGRTALNMPGLSASVADQIAALRHHAGNDTVSLIRHAPDPVIAKIVESWPRAFDTACASALGFVAESSFAQILQVYVEDDLPP